jgi:hypothetical protein
MLMKTGKAGDVVAVLLPIISYTIWFGFDLGSPHNLFNTYEETPFHSIIMPSVRAPWRYRIFPNLIGVGLSKVKLLWPALNFHWAVVWANWAVVVFTAILFYCLLRWALGVSRQWSALATLAVVLSYPLMFGHTVQLQLVIGDAVSYALVVAALLSLFARRYELFTLITIAAVLSRETNLILLIPLLLDDEAHWLNKIVVAALAFGAVVGVRLWLGWESGYLGDGWRANTSTPLVVSLLAVFVTFGAFWLTGIKGWNFYRTQQLVPRNLNLLGRSAPVVVGLMLAANVVFAILTENRILLVLFPWVVGLSAVYLQATVVWPGKQRLGIILMSGVAAGLVSGLALATLAAEFPAYGVAYIAFSIGLAVSYLVWEGLRNRPQLFITL